MSVYSLLTEEQSGMLCFGGSWMALLVVEAGFRGMRRQFEMLIGERQISSLLYPAGANGGPLLPGHLPGRPWS